MLAHRAGERIAGKPLQEPLQFVVSGKHLLQKVIE